MLHRFSFIIQKYGQLQIHVKNVLTHFVEDYSDRMSFTKWPKVIKNEDVYKITNTEQWSLAIKKRRMRLFGHVKNARKYSSTKSTNICPRTI